MKWNFEAELARIRRRVAKLEAVSAGDATVEKVWRQGYTEKKVRTVRGHYMHLVKLKTQPRAATRRRAA